MFYIILTFSPERSVGKNEFLGILTFSPERSVDENEFCENEVEAK